MPPDERRKARDAARRDEPATSAPVPADAADARERERERERRPPVFDAARATSPNATYLRPVAPLDPGPPPQTARQHPDAPAPDEREADRASKPTVRGVPEDLVARESAAAHGGFGARALRIAAIVVLAALALWLILG
jgi:hypothetical protein